MRKFLPIILGSDENAYGCARQFYSAYKAKSLLLCAKPLVATDNSQILWRKVIKNFDKNAVFSSIIEEILQKYKPFFENILLIPCSDYYAELVVRNAEKIRKIVANPILKSEIYDLISDKIGFANLCKIHELPHPCTHISTASLLLQDNPPFSFPIVIKPSNSNSYSYLHADITNKKKVYFCRKESEYREILVNFKVSGYNEFLIVQPFIGGGDSSMRVINAYCDKNAKVRQISVAQPLLEYYDPQSIGNYAAVKVLSDRALCDQAADFLEKIGYVGFANFDIKYDQKTDTYAFFELNPRQGRSSYYVALAGGNLMAEMVEDVVFQSPYSGRKYAENQVIWCNVPREVLEKYVDGEKEKIEQYQKGSTMPITYDFSPRRALNLVKRNYHIKKSFENYYFDKNSSDFLQPM